MKMHDNSLYYGDCLEVMREWPDESVDLIYLDPPFNSNAKYNVLFSNANPGETAQFQAFDDTWYWDEAAIERYGRLSKAVASPLCDYVTAMRKIIPESGMLSYLTYMGERVVELRRVLKSTGSIYLHCDSTAGHYLKILMDSVFGATSFRNQIVWERRQDKHNLAQRHMGKAHDMILFYGKTDMAKYRKQFLSYSEEYIGSHYKHKDSRGLYRTLPCTNESGGNKPYEFRGVNRAWRFKPERMEKMFNAGLLTQSTPGGPFYYKKYLKDAEGVLLQDLWCDIPPARGKEKTGYDTQKPKALLKRIIEASSNPGDLVLDPFCGCGTTVEAANDLKRRWIGIDISSFAVRLIKQKRLKSIIGEVKTHGIPVDMVSAKLMAREQAFQFEAWAVTLIPGMAPNKKQVGDKGIDGRGHLYIEDIESSTLVLVQVKGGNFTANDVRAFARVIEENKAAMGIFLTMDKKVTKDMRTVATSFGSLKYPGSSKEYPRFQFWSIEEYFDDLEPKLPDMRDPYTGKKAETADLFSRKHFKEKDGE